MPLAERMVAECAAFRNDPGMNTAASKSVNRSHSFELLEARIAPAVLVLQQDVGMAPDDILPEVDAFRTALGALNANVAGSFNEGRREINWDGVPDADAAPGRLPGDFFDAISPRGAIFHTPGSSFMVSADGDNPSSAPQDFGNINATYGAAFQTFSASRLFTPLGSNITEITFVIPGTSQPASVRGFGVVLTDVDTDGSKLEFFDARGRLIASQDIQFSGGDASLSFVGMILDEPVAKVRITAGDGPLGGDDISQGGPLDLVVLDDFIYAEPEPLAVARVADRILEIQGDDESNKVRVSVGRKSVTVVQDGDRQVFNPLDFDHIVIRGEGGDDDIRVSGRSKRVVIDGGDGDDRITGTASRDIIFGGTGSDIIRGGRGEDILLGGGKASAIPLIDFTSAELRSMADVWNGPETFTVRLAALQVSAAGRPALDAATLEDTDTNDRIIGQGSLDWILGNNVSEAGRLRRGEIFTAV